MPPPPISTPIEIECVPVDQLKEPAKAELLIHMQGRCAMPTCPSPIRFQATPIEDNTRKLPVGVCHDHASALKRGEIDPDVILTFSQLTEPATKRSTGSVKLATRADYLAAVFERLQNPVSRFYTAYVGPLPLHPQWYYDYRDVFRPEQNMDRAVNRLIRQSAGVNVRIVFRNAPRYLEKVKELATPSVQRRLKADILDFIDEVWGDNGERGPQIACIDTGPYRIPTIFDDCAITASREQSGRPISEGVLVRDQTVVSWEAGAFERLFLAGTRGQATEVFQLKQYVERSL